MHIAMPLAQQHQFLDKRLDRRRVLSWCAIVALHGAFVYALSTGLIRDVSAIMPKVVTAIMIPAREAIPEPPKPLPPPKVVLPPVAPAPPVPQIDFTPAPIIFSGQTPVRETNPPPVAAAVPAPAPEAPPAPAQPRLITGVEYLQAPSPQYPPASRRKGEEGVVQLRVLVNEHGRAERVEIIQSSEFVRLDDAARAAVMRALFKPYLENGRAVAVYAIVPIRFQLG